jgi:hypothetical protein
MPMRRLYLAFAIVGFAIPVMLAPYTLQHPDNLLFILKPLETVQLAFANYASAAFTADLLWVWVVFCAWVVIESRNLGLKHSWAFILLAFLFGVSGPFPLFLYYRERRLVRVEPAA